MLFQDLSPVLSTQCVMASYVRNRGKLPAGRLTGVAPEYETLGADDETELLYVYVGRCKAGSIG